MNHVDVSLFSPHGCQEGPICFLREHMKKSFEAVQEDEKKEKTTRQILLNLILFWNIKSMY